MKVTYIEMSGFRGFRDSTRFEVPSGFAVVTGRNGVGKSTVGDALEFALTGTIRGASEHKEKGETIDDYIWWRGAGPVTDFYVEVGFRRPDGSEIAVRRSPAAFSTKPDTKLNDVFLEAGATLDNPMVRLCRTTIIRDEEITQLSVDLGETERFDFVRAALGTADFSTANDKA